jgi:hypothetical protein
MAMVRANSTERTAATDNQLNDLEGRSSIMVLLRWKPRRGARALPVRGPAGSGGWTFPAGAQRQAAATRASCSISDPSCCCSDGSMRGRGKKPCS